MKKPAQWTRDRVIFIVGLLGVAYETLLDKVERPSLIVLFGAMLGLPAFLRRDEKEDDKDDRPSQHPGG